MASSPAPSRLQSTYTNHKGPVHTVVYSAQGGTYALSGGQDRTVQLWKPGKEGCIKNYTGHGYEVLGIAWYVLRTGLFYPGFLVDAWSGIYVGREMALILLVLMVLNCSAADNKSFASCGGDKTVFVWDTGTGDCKKRFMGHNSKVNAVALSEDAGVLVSGTCIVSPQFPGKYYTNSLQSEQVLRI